MHMRIMPSIIAKKLLMAYLRSLQMFKGTVPLTENHYSTRKMVCQWDLLNF